MPQSLLDRPGADEYAPYYAAYIRLVPPGDLLVHFERQRALMEHRFRALTPDRAGYRYAPDNWSVRDVLCHLTDTERVFSHRA
nr:DinB family protein [Gemmatimonadaceae bacterium]